MSTIVHTLLLIALVFPCLAQAKILSITEADVPGAHGMYVTDTGRIWLADTFKKIDQISKVYNEQLLVISTAPQTLGTAGISKHPTKDIFSFCDVNGSKVLWVNRKGNKLLNFTIRNPWNARWSKSGDSMYVVTYSGEVIHILNGKKQTQVLQGLDAPFDIAPVTENSFWVSEQGAHGKGKVCLYKAPIKGSAYNRVVCNKGYDLSNPEGLWPTPDGGVLAVDTEKGKLVKINTIGEVKLLEEGLGLPIMVQLTSQSEWVIFTNQSNIGPAIIRGRF